MSQALPRMITRKELRLLVPYCPQHILRLEKVGKFPQRVQIGQRRVGWWLHQVLAWIETQNLNHKRATALKDLSSAGPENCSREFSVK